MTLRRLHNHFTTSLTPFWKSRLTSWRIAGAKIKKKSTLLCFKIHLWRHSIVLALHYFQGMACYCATLLEWRLGLFETYFYTPVFRRDVLWYGDVRPGLHPGLRPSVRSPSARFPHFSPTCFDILSWNFAHNFVLMYFRSSLSVITLCQFLKELWLFVNLEYRKYSFPHFSSTCFDILSWHFAHDVVLMYYRSSLSAITLRQFLKELCLFWNLEYRKNTVFRTFLLPALTYWAEILHMTLF